MFLDDPYRMAAALRLLEPAEQMELLRILDRGGGDAVDRSFDATEYAIDVVGRRRIEEEAARFRTGELELPEPLRQRP